MSPSTALASGATDSTTILLGAAPTRSKVVNGTVGHSARKVARLPFLDFLRAIASQLIVLHHLSFYGPLPERAYPAAPLLLDWLSAHARMAVQVFFVLGGFFTSRGLSRGKTLTVKSVASAIVQRYRRIGVPYLVTLVVAVTANELARRWMTHDAISATPTLPQLLAHAAFLHDILGFEALTAGIWYLAVDFQLYLLSLGLFWFAQAWARRRGGGTSDAALRLFMQMMLPLAVASLLWFNRHAKYEIWAIYFVGSYFLGILLHAVLEANLKLSWAMGYFGLAILAALVDPRPRLLVAVGTALVVLLAARTGLLQAWPRSPLVNYLGKISYSLFLIHFPVLLLVNAIGAQYLTTSTVVAVGGLLLAYVLSLGAAVLLYHGIESRMR
jgi:peptidoglycan/LPS O-acetylase OafA/YrhL